MCKKHHVSLALHRLELKWFLILFGPLTFLVPEKFGHGEIWSPRNLCGKKVGPCMKKCHTTNFMRELNFLRPKFIGDKISWGLKKSGPI